jgi:hypothetical protein
MEKPAGMSFMLIVVGAVLLATFSMPVNSQEPSATAAKAAPAIKTITGVWIEGPGFDVTYGVTAAVCAQRCLGNPKCVMIEYYRPEKKCNLYDTIRPQKAGGSSVVGIRQ